MIIVSKMKYRCVLYNGLTSYSQWDIWRNFGLTTMQSILKPMSQNRPSEVFSLIYLICLICFGLCSWRHEFPIDVKRGLTVTIPRNNPLRVDSLWITGEVSVSSLAAPFPSRLSSALIGREGGGTSSPFMFTFPRWRKEWQCPRILPEWHNNKEVSIWSEDHRNQLA